MKKKISKSYNKNKNSSFKELIKIDYLELLNNIESFKSTKMNKSWILKQKSMFIDANIPKSE